MKLIERRGRVEIWQTRDGEFFVYGVTLSGDPYAVPSIGMARELAS